MSRSHNVPHLSDIPNPSALVSLQFTNRNRTSLEGLPKFKNLTDLDISKNQLTGKEVELASLRYLKRLNLSRNDFETIEELPKTLEHLNLSSNRIQSLNDFCCLSRLHTLNLTNNCISTLEPLASVQTLRCLFVGFNLLEDLRGIESFRNLIEVDIEYNLISDPNELALIPDSVAAVNIGGNPVQRGLL